jgi:hypothetical protein
MKKLRYILFSLILIVMILPLAQDQFKIFKTEELRGAITPSTDTVFTLSGWISGKYQKQKDKYLTEAFGFRSTAIRINNQIAFDLFNKAKANGCLVGKENYLYEENYVKAYLGQDFIGNDSIQKRMRKLKYVQDTLAKLGKSVVFIIEPGKGFFYPEYFPNQYDSIKAGKTNYAYYLKYASAMKVNLIDFNGYFIRNKKTSKYLLYPKYGIHWSVYGAALAADSIIKYIERLRTIDLPGLYWNKVETADAKGSDVDIAKALNLLFDDQQEKMGYPIILFEAEAGKTKPKTVVIADSFYWLLMDLGIKNSFDDHCYWYYNREIYCAGYDKTMKASEMKLQEEIKNYDVFMIMVTDANLPNAGWGFIEDTYKLYAPRALM